MLLRCATVDYRNVCDVRQREEDFLHSWPVVLPKFSGKIVPVKIKTLSKTNFVACESIRLPEIRLRLGGYKFCGVKAY